MVPFRAQIVVVVAASVAMLALAVVLVRDVITRTETRLVAEALRQCGAACRELRSQFDDRMAFGADDPLGSLPWPSQDMSLRGLSSTVLRSYEGVDGGFLAGPADRVAGFSRAGTGLSPEERALVAAAAAEARRTRGQAGHRAVSGGAILVAVAELDRSGGVVAWTLKRVAGLPDPAGERRRWLLAALVASAVLGMAGLVSIWLSLRSGVAGVQEGLRRLEDDFEHRLPQTRGDFGRIAAAINRMTARRTALETELRRQDRLAALGRAVAGVAHEIRNPLNSMKLSLELLRRRLARGEASPAEVEGAIQELDSLDRIVGRLLAFGRPALTDRRPQPVAPVVDAAARMVREQAAAKGVRIETGNAAGAELEADIDAPQIQQVLINLLLNAVEASPPGETVRVSSGRHGGAVVVSVADRGPGVPAGARPHVFDLYFTTKPDGVGLGLSVSREIVRQHGGRLDFASEPGRTVFRVELPAGRTGADEA